MSFVQLFLALGIISGIISLMVRRMLLGFTPQELAVVDAVLAAGFSIKEENIPAFRRRMQALVRSDTGGEEMVSTLQIDGEIESTCLLTVEQVEALSMLEPYGAGNPKPVFSLSGVTVTCMADVGGGRHLKMRASRDGRTVDMIFFSVTRAKSGLVVGDKADVAFYPQINEYRGSRTVQLHLVDLRPAYTAQERDVQALYRKYARGELLTPCEARAMIPQREEYAAVWRYLANRGGEVTDMPVRRRSSANSTIRMAFLASRPISMISEICR